MGKEWQKPVFGKGRLNVSCGERESEARGRVTS